MSDCGLFAWQFLIQSWALIRFSLCKCTLITSALSVAYMYLRGANINLNAFIQLVCCCWVFFKCYQASDDSQWFHIKLFTRDARERCRWDGASCLCLLTETTWQKPNTARYHTLRQFISTPSIIVLCRACISNAELAYSWVCRFLYKPVYSELSSVAQQLLCIWLYSSPHPSFDIDASCLFLRPLVLLSYLKIV